jgi:hypothetical protein
MRRLLLSLLLGLSLPLSAPAFGAPLALKMCIFDHPFPPMTFPDGSGQAQELLRRASRLQPVLIQNVVKPRFDCMEQLRTGQVDAMLAAFIEDRTSYGAFPMAGSQPDTSRAVGELNFSVSRRQGGTVEWDGRRFDGLGRQPVGTQPGLLQPRRAVSRSRTWSRWNASARRWSRRTAPASSTRCAATDMAKNKGHTELYLVDLRAANPKPQRLTSDAASSTDPEWSPPATPSISCPPARARPRSGACRRTAATPAR